MAKRTKKERVHQRIAKASEAAGRFRGLLESAPDAMVVVDSAGKIVFVNTQTEKLFGYPRGEMLGRGVELLVPERLREQHRHHRTHFFIEPRTRPMAAEYQLFGLRKDGTQFPVEVSLSPIETKKGVLVASAIRDITERKLAEESRLRLATIVESSDDAITSVTLDGVIATWNAGAQKIYGYTESEVVGKSLSFLVPPERLEEEAHILETLKAGGRINQFETVRLTKAGKRINVSLSLSAIRNATGEIVRVSGIARDISERKRAEEALRASEERLRLAQHAARIGTFERNLRTDTITWSSELGSMWGLPPGAFDGTGTAYFENMIHPDDRERVMNLNDEAIKTGHPTRAQWRIVWPDGSIHWIAAAWQAFMDESGQAARVIGVNSDITERKEAEDRLREYERAVEGVEELITVIDSEYRCRMANRGFLKRRNLTKEQVVGHFAHEFIAKEPYERVIKAKLAECFQGKVVRYELKYTYPELGERDLLISYYPIRGNNGVDRAACIVHDITDRKRSEEALRESEERFRLAANAGRMYSFDWDIKTGEVVRSPEHTRVLGLAEPLRSSHSEFLHSIHPDDRERFVATTAGLTPENPSAVVTYRVMTPQGALVWVRSSGRGIFDTEGRLQRVIGMVADVTDLKRAEEALAEMTRKLIEAQEQERARIARELHDDIGQRLALVAVELDQIQGDRTEISHEVRRSIGELQKQIQDLSVDLHALSHDLHSSKLEYLGVVAGIRSWCEEFGQRHRIEVAFSSTVSTTLPFEFGLSLFRVLQQALQNAVKHSGVRRVEVQLRETADEIHLVISDSGRGFDVETALRGKGLGLSSMSERVRLVNGTISIESKPMRGTTIRVKVPIGSERLPHRAAG